MPNVPPISAPSTDECKTGATHFTYAPSPTFSKWEYPDSESAKRQNPWIDRTDNNNYPFKRGCYLTSRPEQTGTTGYDYSNPGTQPTFAADTQTIAVNNTAPDAPSVSNTTTIYTGSEEIVPPEAIKRPSTSRNWLQFFIVMLILGIGTGIIIWLICGDKCKSSIENMEKRKNLAVHRIKLWLRMGRRILRNGDTKDKRPKKSKFREISSHKTSKAHSSDNSKSPKKVIS